MADGGAQKAAEVFLKAEEANGKGDEARRDHEKGADTGAEGLVKLPVGNFPRFAECGSGFLVDKRVGDF